MKIKIKRILASLSFICILGSLGLAQNEVPEGKLPTPIYPDASGGREHLILIPELAAATRNDGWVTIPFALKNNSDHVVRLVFTGNQIDGLAIVDQAGKTRFIQNLHRLGNYWEKSGPVFPIILNPGEANSHFCSVYSLETLSTVTGRKIFGVISGSIGNPNKTFKSYSAPFLIPPALVTLPWNDLGAQNYLSVTPDLTQVYFSGGNFKNTTIELQRADPKYADSIKNGWTEDVMIPFSVKNTSNQDLVVSINGIGYYIVGNEKGKNEATQGGGWYLIKLSTPIVKPNESISNDSQWKLSWLEAKGYKPGDKIVAVVGGRIPNTNKIFECYSAPFELPPLPKGEPPTPAGKQ